MCELDEKVWGWVPEWKPERGVQTLFRVDDIDILGCNAWEYRGCKCCGGRYKAGEECERREEEIQKKHFSLKNDVINSDIL